MLIVGGFGVNYAVTTQDATSTEEVASIDKEKKGKKKKGKAGCCAGEKAESCSKAKAAGCCAGKAKKES